MSSKSITVRERMIALGLNFSERDVKTIGRMVSKRYYNERGELPSSVDVKEKDRNIEVRAYKEYPWRGLIDKTIDRFYQSKLDRLTAELSKQPEDNLQTGQQIKKVIYNLGIMNDIRHSTKQIIAPKGKKNIRA
jgi:hypothetical protein